MLGIDIGSYAVKAATVKSSGNKASVEQFAIEVLPLESQGGKASVATLQEVTKRLLKKLGKSNDKVCLSIPTASSIIKTIEIDKGVSGDALEGEVQMQLLNIIPFPLEQVYTDFSSLGVSSQDPNKQDVFVAASRKDIVNKVASAVEDKLVKSKEVDIEGLVYAQVLEKIKGNNYRDNYAVIDIGYQTTRVYIYNNGSLIFNREQQIGGLQLTESISEAFGLSLEEAEQRKLSGDHSEEFKSIVLNNYLDNISEQIALAIEFFHSTSAENQIESAYLCGGGSLVNGLTASLSENIPSTRFEILPTHDKVKYSRKVGNFGENTVSAVGSHCFGLGMRK